MKIIRPLLLPLFFLSLLLLFTSCGNKTNSSSLPRSEKEAQVEELDDPGSYRAVLRPLNKIFAGETTGTLEIKITTEEFSVAGQVVGAPANVRHLQNIMALRKCPGDEADMNQDGVIDIAELVSVSGKILLPLDSDLSAQLDGLSFGPIANSSGQYSYKRSTLLSPLVSDLGSVDPDPTDLITKLPAGKNLDLSGRVIVIHGISETAGLPSTARAAGDYKAEVLLPIACAELVRVHGEGLMFIAP